MSREINPEVERTVAFAASAFRRAGENWTSLREAVLRSLATHRGAASAYLIKKRLARFDGREVAANSVYRILHIFLDLGLVSRVESVNGYVINRRTRGSSAPIYLLCIRCGSLRQLHDKAVNRHLRSLAERAQISEPRFTLEVQGVCRTCAESPVHPSPAIPDQRRKRGQDQHLILQFSSRG